MLYLGNELTYIGWVQTQVGTGISVAKEVAEVQKLLKASGLSFTMHSAGTTVGKIVHWFSHSLHFFYFGNCAAYISVFNLFAVFLFTPANTSLTKLAML